MSWWLLAFSREYPARYLSHLDTVRALQRTFARAGVPIALSEGMRPKPRISLPLPLPVGAAGREELALLKAAEEAPGPLEALRALCTAAPPGLRPLSITVLGERRPHPQPLEAEYECELDGPWSAILAALERYRAADAAEVERVSPKGRRCIDLKEFLIDAAAVETEEGRGCASAFGTTNAARRVHKSSST